MALNAALRPIAAVAVPSSSSAGGGTSTTSSDGGALDLLSLLAYGFAVGLAVRRKLLSGL